MYPRNINTIKATGLLTFINNLQMRKLLVVLSIILLTQAITDKEVIQESLNGLFEENKLPHPTTIVRCIDDATAHKIVVFAGQVL
jgi:hypothetical protein